MINFSIDEVKNLIDLSIAESDHKNPYSNRICIPSKYFDELKIYYENRGFKIHQSPARPGIDFARTKNHPELDHEFMTSHCYLVIEEIKINN